MIYHKTKEILAKVCLKIVYKFVKKKKKIVYMFRVENSYEQSHKITE